MTDCTDNARVVAPTKAQNSAKAFRFRSAPMSALASRIRIAKSLLAALYGLLAKVERQRSNQGKEPVSLPRHPQLSWEQVSIYHDYFIVNLSLLFSSTSLSH